MKLPTFEIGYEYERSALLSAVGSKQQQTGVIWGVKNSDVVIITSGGKDSHRAGYADKRHKDGSWDYYGQGISGDQHVHSFANNLLASGVRSILLFSTRQPTRTEVQERKTYAKLYKYEGMFLTSSWEYFIPSTGSRRGDSLLLFHLVPARDAVTVAATAQVPSSNESSTLASLRRNILQLGIQPTLGNVSAGEYRRRSALITAYAKVRAAGICENCGNLAPFLDINGKPFLEVHHIQRLADDGPDIPENVAAICPNCHSEAHYGRDTTGFRHQLAERIRSKEMSL